MMIGKNRTDGPPDPIHVHSQRDSDYSSLPIKDRGAAVAREDVGGGPVAGRDDPNRQPKAASTISRYPGGFAEPKLGPSEGQGLDGGRVYEDEKGRVQEIMRRRSRIPDQAVSMFDSHRRDPINDMAGRHEGNFELLFGHLDTLDGEAGTGSSFG